MPARGDRKPTGAIVWCPGCKKALDAIVYEESNNEQIQAFFHKYLVRKGKDLQSMFGYNWVMSPSSCECKSKKE